MSSSQTSSAPVNSATTPKKTLKRRNRTRRLTKTKKQGKDIYYPIRCIKQERVDPVKGLEYLIDWENDPETGKEYEPSWEPEANATKLAIDEWEASKLETTQVNREEESNRIIAVESSQESEPVRPAKRKRTSANSLKPASPKRPRKAGTVESRRYWGKQEANPDEIADSYASEGQSLQTQSPKYQVEVPGISDSFPRAEYCVVPQSLDLSSTPSAFVEPPHDLETPAKPLNDPVLYDGEGIVPDSQELPGSSSYVPSESVTGATTSTRPNTASNSEVIRLTDIENAEGYTQFSPDHIPESTDVERESSEVSKPPTAREILNQVDADRDRTFVQLVEKAKGGFSAPDRSVPSKSVSESTPDIDPENNLEPVPSRPLPELQSIAESKEIQPSAPKSSYKSRSEASPLGLSSIFIPRSESLSDLPTARTRRATSADIGHGASTTRLRQHSRSEGVEIEDLEFQTQVPFLRDNSIVDESDLDSILRERAISDDVEFQSTSPQSPGKEPQELEPEDQNDESFGSDELWQGAQIVQPLDAPPQSISGGSDFQIFDESRIENALEPASETRDSQNSLGRSFPLAQRNSNSQPSTSQIAESQIVSGDTTQSKEGIYATVTSTENVIESIEAHDSLLPQTPSIPSSCVSHFLETYGGEYPPRPTAPSFNDSSSPPDTDMADAGPVGDGPKLSVAEMLKQVRARSAAAARSAAEARSTRSPSEIPQRRPPVLESSLMSQALPVTDSGPVSQILPVREAAIVPSVETLPPTPTLAAQEPLDQLEDALHPSLGSMEYIVLLPMANFVRDVHVQAIYNLKNAITSFLDGDDKGSLGEQMDTLIATLKLLSDHQDLTVEVTASQGRMSDAMQSKWAESCSTKCYFLKELFEAVRSLEIHIAVLARPGRMLDILEVILKVNGFDYDRPDRSSRSGPGAFGPLKITILPTGLNGGEFVVNRADAVIAFDTTFHDGERYSKILRAHLYEPKKLSPLIYLAVINSVEHLELCLPKDMNPVLKRTQTIEFITQTRHTVGILDSDFPPPDQAASVLATYLSTGIANGADWPLPLNADIIGVELSAEPRSQSYGSTTQSQDYPRLQMPTPQGAMKRSYDDRLDEESSKRMRMTPVPRENTSSGSVNRVSESLAQGSEVNTVISGESNTATNAPHDAQSDQISVLLTKIAALEIEVEEVTRTETQLRQSKNELEVRLSSYIALISKIHPKYQDALKERATAQSTMETAQAQVSATNQRIEARIADIAKLKEEKATLQAELTAARASLVGATVPSLAEVAQAQDSVRTLQDEKARLEKRISNMQRDFDFTRAEYQKASNSAAELFTEVSTIKEEADILRRQASSNLVTVAEIQRSSESKELEDRIDELEAQVAEYQNELARKNEELKAKMNGRRETRGTSVPRSPRLGSGAMSPRPYGTTIRIGGSASRGTSPAPGGEGMVLSMSAGGGVARDPVLFPPQQRWGYLRGEP